MRQVYVNLGRSVSKEVGDYSEWSENIVDLSREGGSPGTWS